MGDTVYSQKKEYSIIIPIRNEYVSIVILYNALSNVMNNLRLSYEILIINDCSCNEDMDTLRGKFDKNIVRIIDIPMHIGQSGALAEGFKNAKGKFIISMDGDLQDSPEYIPFFINEINKGLDAVCGYRIKRKDSQYKIVLSKIGNHLQRIIFQNDIHDIGCTYRIYRENCIKELKLTRNGYHRYIPLLLIRRGYKVGEIKIHQHKRIFGHSKYSFWKPLAVLLSSLFLICDMIRRRV